MHCNFQFYFILHEYSMEPQHALMHYESTYKIERIRFCIAEIVFLESFVQNLIILNDKYYALYI